MVQASKQSMLGTLCSDGNTFSHPVGARRARGEIFFCHCILFAEAFPTSYRMTLGGFAKYWNFWVGQNLGIFRLKKSQLYDGINIHKRPLRLRRGSLRSG